MSDATEHIATMFADTLSDVQSGGEQLSQQMAAGQAKVADLTDQIIAKLGRKSVQYPPQVLTIANVLTAQPQLIPIVEAYLAAVTAELNAAVAAVIQKHAPPAPPAPPVPGP